MVERNKSAMDPAPYQAAMRRLKLLVPGCGIIGVVAALVGFSWGHALGVAIGSAAGWVNFLLLVKVVDSLGSGVRQPAKRTGFLLLGALGVLGGLGFGIIRVFGIHPEPLFAGLAAPLVAVILTIFYELFLVCKNMKPGLQPCSTTIWPV